MLRHTTLAAALAAFCCTSAGAAVVASSPGGVDQYEFSWTNTPYSEEFGFVSGSVFDFSVLSYSGTGGEQTGFYLENLDTSERFTDDTNACDNAAWVDSGTCDLVTPSTPPSVLFSGLSAGNYVIGVYDSATPVSGSVTFGVSPVPVPASALLLLGAFGGLGALARRRT